MPIDVSSAVEPTYEPTVLVPLDGEYANSAQLQNMMLGALNRIEYLRQGLESAPWRESVIFDDFTIPLTVVDGASMYASDTMWDTTGSTNWASLTISGLGDVEHIGLMRLTNASGNVTEALLRKTLGLCPIGALQRITCQLRTGNIASGNSCEVGLSPNLDPTPGDTSVPKQCVTATFIPSASANWRLRVHDGTTETFQDTGVPVVAGQWYQLDLTNTGSAYALSIDGAAPVSISSPLPSPTGAATLLMKFANPTSGATRRWDVDFIRSVIAAPDRVL